MLDLSVQEIILRLLLGTSISFLVGLTGVGGGVLLIPAMKLFLVMPTSLAVGTASLYITATKVMSTVSYARQKNIDYTSSIRFLIGAIPGVFIVAFPINYLLERHQSTTLGEQIEYTLTLIVVAVIFFSLAVIAWDMIKKDQKQAQGQHSKKGDASLAKAIAAGFFCGAIIGATGIGGGVLIVPALISFLKIDLKRTIGSSIFIALVVSALSALIYAEGGNADLSTAVLLVIGGIPGVLLSSIAMRVVSVKWLQIALLLLIALSAVLVLIDL